MDRPNSSWSWMSVSVSLLLVAAAGVVGAGCGMFEQSTSPQSSDDQRDGPGIAVSSAALSNSGTAKIRFKIYKQGTSQKVASGIRELSDLKIPGGLSSPALDKLDEESKHAFADFYTVLKADRRYDVKTIPLDASGMRNDRCDVAWAKDVLVEDGRTSEILVINQCDGEKRGGLDVISSLNRSPHLKSLKFYPSKFIRFCKERAAICYTAKDPDNDPLRSEVELIGSKKCKAELDPFPKEFFNKCKKACSGPATTPNGAGGNSGGGSIKGMCLPKCVVSLQAKRKKRCDMKCRAKCPSGAADGGEACRKKCKQRCLTPKGKLRRCVLVKPKKCGTLTLKATVLDQLWFDGKNAVTGQNSKKGNYTYNRLIDFETFYKKKGRSKKKSRDSLTFPLHVGGKCEKKRIGFENIASVTSDEEDVDADNNTDSATVKAGIDKKYCEFKRRGQ